MSDAKNGVKKMNKMTKTTKAKCRKCKYSGGSYDGYPLCGYYLLTGERRNCEVGMCDKYKKCSSQKPVL